jgi:hypothetical protein
MLPHLSVSMGRVLLVIAGLVLVGVMSSSANPDQFWASSGNNIYNTNSGYVGIGTTTPLAPLDVRRASPGNNQVVGIFSNPGDAPGSQASIDLGIGSSSPTTWRLRGTQSQLYIENAVGGAPAIAVDSSNRVAIGGGLNTFSNGDVALHAATGTVPMILITGPQAVVAFGEANGVWAWGGQAGGHFEGGTGVYASSSAPSGEGVHGHGTGQQTEGVLGTSDQAVGVYGISGGTSNLGIGVWGQANATSGETEGVYGLSESSSGRGVFGEATAGNGFTLGVYGLTHSSGGVGIRAESTADPAAAPWARILDATRPGDTEFKVQVDGNVFADGSFSGGGADYADMFSISGKRADYEPGDVLVIGPDGQLTKSDKPYSTAVAGVYSTQPAFVGDPRGAREEDEMSAEADNLIPVTLVGVAPVKATTENGLIQPGDLLTSSSIPGHAMKAKPVVINGVEIYPTGAILGKALEPLESGTGVIQVLVMLR